jgi:hypothetical protein
LVHSGLARLRGGARDLLPDGFQTRHFTVRTRPILL